MKKSPLLLALIAILLPACQSPLDQQIIEDQDLVRFDRAHFQGYGDFALTFETVYYVLSPDYNVYMDIQQAINLEIYRQFEERQIRFAYPTQTLYLNHGSRNTAPEQTAASIQPA